MQVIGITPQLIESVIVFLHSHLQTDEPIDSFELCNKDKLDSCLKTPFQRPEKDTFLEELIEKSSLLFFLLIENHVLPTNGNKRLAVQSFLVMAWINGYVISSSTSELYRLTMVVTDLSKKRFSQEKILVMIMDYCREHFVLSDVTDETQRSEIAKDFNDYLLS